MNRIIILLLLFTLLFGCSRKKINGLFYNKIDNNFYEFNNQKLLIYNITDSLKISYSFKIINDKIEFYVKNKIVRLPYLIEKDSLWMFDNQYDFSTRNQIGLSKIRLKNIKFNNDIFYKDYWHYYEGDTLHCYYKFMEDKEMKSIFIYGKDDIGMDITTFSSNLFFNKFKIIGVYSDRANNDKHLDFHLVLDETKNSLKLLNLRTNFQIDMNKYKSYEDNALFGSWVTVTSNNIDLIVSTDQPWYFGDTITFTKEMSMKRKLINDGKYHYLEDTLDKEFEIGLDTKFLIYKTLKYTIFEINKLTKDTLIINNSTLDSKMKYVRIVNDVN